MPTVWSEFDWLGTATTKLEGLKLAYRDTSVRLLKYWSEIRNNPTWAENEFTYSMFGVSDSVMEKFAELESDLHWFVEKISDSAINLIGDFAGTIDFIGEAINQTIEDLNHDFDEFKNWITSLELSWPTFSYDIKVEYLGEFIAAKESLMIVIDRMTDYIPSIQLFARITDGWVATDGVDPDVDIYDTDANVLDLSSPDFYDTWINKMMAQGGVGTMIGYYLMLIKWLIPKVPTTRMHFKIPQIMNAITGMIPYAISAISKLFSGLITGIDYGGTFIQNFLDKSTGALTSAMNNYNYQYASIEIPTALLQPVSLGRPSTVRRAGWNDVCVWCQYKLVAGDHTAIIEGWGTGNPDTLLICPECDNSLLDPTIFEIAADWSINILKILAVLLLVKGVGAVLKAYKTHRSRSYKKYIKETLSGTGTAVDELLVDVADLTSAIMMLEGSSPFVEMMSLIEDWLLYLADPSNREPPN